MRFSSGSVMLKSMLVAMLVSALNAPASNALSAPKIISADPVDSDTQTTGSGRKIATTQTSTMAAGASAAAGTNIGGQNAAAAGAKSAAGGKNDGPKPTTMTAQSTAALRRAYSLMTIGDVNGAINTLSSTIRSEPCNPDMRRYLSFALLQRRSARQAITQLDALTILNSLIAYDLCMKGQALHMMGENMKAADAFESANEMDPANKYIRDQLIESLQIVGKYSQAADACATAYYQARTVKEKDRYLKQFNQIQEARAYMKARDAGLQTTQQVASAGDQPAMVGQLEMTYGSNASSFATPPAQEKPKTVQNFK